MERCPGPSFTNVHMAVQTGLVYPLPVPMRTVMVMPLREGLVDQLIATTPILT